MSSSQWRREPTPAAARYLLRRSIRDIVANGGVVQGKERVNQRQPPSKGTIIDVRPMYTGARSQPPTAADNNVEAVRVDGVTERESVQL
jgi:hypothetical protein